MTARKMELDMQKLKGQMNPNKTNCVLTDATRFSFVTSGIYIHMLRYFLKISSVAVGEKKWGTETRKGRVFRFNYSLGAQSVK